MTRYFFVLISSGLLAGCATQHPAPQTVAVLRYEPATAAVLAFDVPAAAGATLPDISRENRQPQAFYGYESITATYYGVGIDDRQGNDGFDRYERRAVSSKIGVVYR